MYLLQSSITYSNLAADYAELSNAVLLVAKLDRLSRDLHFVTSLQKRGIRFKLCDLPEIDQLTIHILAAMAEHEARMISVRTKQAMQEAKRRGVERSGTDHATRKTLLGRHRQQVEEKVMTTLSAAVIIYSIVMMLKGRELLNLITIIILFLFPQFLILLIIGSALFPLLRK